MPHVITYTEEVEEHGYCQQRPELRTGDKYLYEVGGKKWYKQTYTINEDYDAVSFVFSTGSGSPQTVDVTNVTTDKFFEISTTKNSEGKYLVDDVTSQYQTNNDAEEIVAIINYMMGKAPAGFDEKAADKNGDGKIDIADIIFILK